MSLYQHVDYMSAIGKKKVWIMHNEVQENRFKRTSNTLITTRRTGRFADVKYFLETEIYIQSFAAW